ncbi:MAG: hypothetical protein HYZ95_02750 [Candidatus Omnitrophica bacterium]|nr:hypothetical protein [Candidatus Omnitrophota bacterium]
MSRLSTWALASAAVLTLYLWWIVRPQVLDLRRRCALPEFQGTAHVVRLRFCLDRMTRLWSRVRAAIVALAALSILLRALQRWI